MKVQPGAMFSMDFRAGTLDTPQGHEIIDRLNGGIAELTDTRRQAITLDYTSRRLYQYGFSDFLYQYWMIILLAVLLVIALILVAVLKSRAVRAAHEEKIRQLVDHDPLTGVLSLMASGNALRNCCALIRTPHICLLSPISRISNSSMKASVCLPGTIFFDSGQSK